MWSRRHNNPRTSIIAPDDGPPRSWKAWSVSPIRKQPLEAASFFSLLVELLLQVRNVLSVDFSFVSETLLICLVLSFKNLQSFRHLLVVKPQAVAFIRNDLVSHVDAFRHKPAVTFTAWRMIDLIYASQFDKLRVDLAGIRSLRGI
jgi:hypothetical protein